EVTEVFIRRPFFSLGSSLRFKHGAEQPGKCIAGVEFCVPSWKECLEIAGPCTGSSKLSWGSGEGRRSRTLRLRSRRLYPGNLCPLPSRPVYSGTVHPSLAPFGNERATGAGHLAISRAPAARGQENAASPHPVLAAPSVPELSGRTT